MRAGNPQGLWEIDKTTGNGTFIGNTGVSVQALACSESNGKLYGVEPIWINNFSADSLLLEINAVTGQASVIGNIGFSVQGLAYDSGHGILYGVTYVNKLLTINTVNGTGTLLGPPGRDGLASLAFYPYTGWLYAVDRLADNLLYRVNPQTLAGATNGLVGTTIRGLTYDPKTKSMYGSGGSLVKINPDLRSGHYYRESAQQRF